MAWGAAMCSMSDSLKERKRAFELNVSAVATNQRGQWLFRSLHFSNLTGPVQAVSGEVRNGMDAQRREFLLSLGKWSMVVIGAAVLTAERLPSVAEAGWLNGRGGGGGWINGGGGGWINRRGGAGWLNAR